MGSFVGAWTSSDSQAESFSGSGASGSEGKNEKKCGNFRRDAFRCQPISEYLLAILAAVSCRVILARSQSGFLNTSDESSVARVIRQEVSLTRDAEFSSSKMQEMSLNDNASDLIKTRSEAPLLFSGG